jgi:hydrogenase-4 component B
VANIARADEEPIGLAGTALALVAGNGLTLAVGVAAATAFRTRMGNIGPILSIVCLIAAFALMGHSGDLAAIRSNQPPDALHEAAILALTLIAATALLTTAPVLAAYLLLRVLFDLCGPVQSIWWGVPLLIVGAATAITTTLRAAFATTLHSSMTASIRHLFGLGAVALGTALLARSIDLPALTSLALEAFWLSVVCLVLSDRLLLIVADAAENAAGTRQLDKLGGLIRGMPTTSACCLIGLFAIAMLPPGLGFAAFWRTFTALLSANRADGTGLQWLFAISASAIALSVALAVVAAIRVFATAFLGRPRTPRAAAAEESPRTTRLALTGLAALLLALGAVPDMAHLAAIGWTGGTVFALNPRPAYSATLVAVLLAAFGSIAMWARRQGAGRERRREAAWMDGFASPPAWLPFGDPATQIGPASFIDPLRRLLPSAPTLPVQTWSARCRALLERIEAAVRAFPVPATLIVIVIALAAWLVAS